MKNLYTKNEFLNLKQDDMINEGFIGKMFKSLWQGVVKLSKKIKGTKAIDQIYDKYKNLLDQAYNKFANVSSAGQVTKPATAVKQPVTANTNATSESKINEEVTEEQGNLANLTPEKIAEIAKLIQNRITELKKQFENDVNQIIAKLSKNPDYASDKLALYSTVKKNEFSSYAFDQLYNFYQKSGDKTKLTELITVKKQNDLKFKKSIDELNSKLGEQQEEQVIARGKRYKYHSEKQGKDIVVQVIGKELGKDEKGVEDTIDPDHKTMWKVKTDKGSFWLPASALKEEVKKPKTEKIASIKIEDIKVGDQYAYTPKDKNGNFLDSRIVTVVANDGKSVTVKDGKFGTKYAPKIDRLKPTK